ncbi:integral membrane protein [Cordyceps javanica]|uniref:Integral membrane protein n=1 Tax=Cordyceps javanica TaxID=43265 RepID=A0A545W3A8_9HYPO|nr:integral membrane protein [Cordyceps javanica]TQW08473.1 integral membrane protein [Cordyceps javanica]
MASNKTTSEGLHIPNTPDTKEGWNFLYANIPLLVLSAGVVAFRVWWRCIKHNAGTLNRADICVVIGLVFNVIQVACVSTAIVQWGFGHHAPYLTPEQRYNSLFYFFIFQCFVKNTVGISKLSFLFLYLDIFPQHRFRIICWGLIIHICLGLLALNITTILQCRPIPFSWDKTLHGKCINIKAFWYAQSGWNTFMDVVVLLLPVPLVVKLQMNRRSKFGLLIVFILGTFVCITSIERMISLNFNATFAKDFTWATGTSVIWTQVESTVGVICACAPSLRQPLASFIPKLFGPASEDSYQLSDTPHHLGPRSGTFGHSKGSRKRGGDLGTQLDTQIDPAETTYDGQGSSEEIVGIKRTMSVDVTYIPRQGEPNADGTTTYPKHQFERHMV